MTLPEIGSILQAQVDRVENYGVYLKHGDATLIVLAPEVSWKDCRPLREQFQVGEIRDVFVLAYNYRDRIIIGSFRRLHPEQSPYRELSRLDPGEILKGKVWHTTGQSATILLPNGAWGELSKSSGKGRKLAVGDEVPVTIAALNVDEPRLWLDLAPQDTPTTTPSAVPSMAGSPT